MNLNFYIHESSKSVDVKGADSARIYKECNVVNSFLGENVSIGDFSRIKDCSFDENVTIQSFLYTLNQGVDQRKYLK